MDCTVCKKPIKRNDDFVEITETHKLWKHWFFAWFAWDGSTLAKYHSGCYSKEK
ncbi:hypothetical protein LCGC14_1862180 [marine sediment metagenome]|uniref:Uncharacterized protein n=1 Tax=marine sediment metagenome TaxID=412755 RepID=A0A0F9J651_9ZZZZ